MNSLSIADLRAEMGLSQEEFGNRIGLASKGGVSKIERGLDAVSVSVALAIEALSIRDGVARIDAADLNADVAKSRAALVRPNVHSAAPTGETSKPGSDNISNDLTPDQNEGIAA